MEITYIGHSCFKIKTTDLTIVIDPYDPKKAGYKFPSQTCDVLLTTHDHDDHHNINDVSGYKLLVESPGEYEISGAFIQGIPSFHDDKEGVDRGLNTIYVIEIDGFTLLHLGDLGHVLDKATMEDIPEVDILMVPVGGVYTIGAEKAAKVISSVEPKIVIPMHYQTPDLTGLSQKIDSVDKFLDEMGVEGGVKKQDKLAIKSKGDVPDETEVVLLTPQH